MSKKLSFAFSSIQSSFYRHQAIRHISYLKGALCFGDVNNLAPTNNSDILYINLKNAQSQSDVLNIVNVHHQIMNSRHALQALITIYDTRKEKMGNLSTTSLLKHPDFERLCKNVKKNAGVLQLNDVIDAIKIISQLGVPANSAITQTLLQIIRQNVNFLSIKQVVFLDFLLRTLKTSPLVEALKIALPLVFEIIVPKKMDRDNPAHMADCLYYAVRSNVSKDLVYLIVRSLESCPKEFSGQTSKSIIWSLCNTSVQRDDRFEVLIRKSSTDLIVNIDNISSLDMEITLGKMVHKYTRRYSFYYQEVLFDTCANYVIDNKRDFKVAVAVLRNLARMHHFHKGLIDYVSTLVYKNPSLHQDAVEVYSIVIALVLTDYKPVFWDNLKEWIRTAKNLASENKNEIIWIRFAAALCILDIYKIDVLSRAFTPTYLNHLFSKGFSSDFENYFTCWHSIMTYKPDLIDMLPSNLEPKNLIEKFKNINEFSLETALHEGLGGKDFVLTKIFSKLGAIIDHVILFKKGGNPVRFSKDIKFIEDIKLENNQDLVLIFALREYHYTINTKNIRAGIIRTMNILEQSYTNSRVLPVNVEYWMELNDFEKVPYLMQRIRNKLDSSTDSISDVL